MEPVVLPDVYKRQGLFGEPKDATYYPNIGPNGIDTSGTLVMEYDGFSAVCTGSKDSDSPGSVSYTHLFLRYPFIVNSSYG